MTLAVEQLVEEIDKINNRRVGVYVGGYFEDEGQVFRAIHSTYIDSDGNLILMGAPMNEN